MAISVIFNLAKWKSVLLRLRATGFIVSDPQG